MRRQHTNRYRIEPEAGTRHHTGSLLPCCCTGSPPSSAARMEMKMQSSLPNAVILAWLAILACSTVANGQAVNRDDVFYVLPASTEFGAATPQQLDGDSWTVDLNEPAAVRAAVVGTIA